MSVAYGQQQQQQQQGSQQPNQAHAPPIQNANQQHRQMPPNRTVNVNSSGPAPPPSPAHIQKVLDENCSLIQTIQEFQHAGKSNECMTFHQALHRNLVYLAQLAGENYFFLNEKIFSISFKCCIFVQIHHKIFRKFYLRHIYCNHRLVNHCLQLLIIHRMKMHNNNRTYVIFLY